MPVPPKKPPEKKPELKKAEMHTGAITSHETLMGRYLREGEQR